MRSIRILMHVALLISLTGIFLYKRATHCSEESLDLLYVILGVIIVLLVILFFENRTRALRKNCRLLEEKEVVAKKVLKQKNLLSHRNKEIVDSLKYAHRIQTAMFTSEKEMRRLFPESFVLQRPKDIVSGDFYWFKEIDDCVYFSVADCTGHGVPGAFVSLLGLEFLRQIIIERKIQKPSDVLNELNVQFNKAFANTDDISLRDGMDLSFCAYRPHEMELEFSGAFHSVYIIRNNEILEIKGDRKSVGPNNGLGIQSFTNQTVSLEEGDIIYLFSDGYPDQFGGPKGKKFKYRRFRHQLLTIHKLPMDQQQKILQENIVQWMGELEQIDDIMILGIKPTSYALSSSEPAPEIITPSSSGKMSEQLTV